LRTYWLAIALFVTCGCATSTKSVRTEPSDVIVEQLIALSPFDGYWVSDNPNGELGDFAGQFDDLTFVRLSKRQNGLIVCRLEGTGALWTRKGELIPFKITGQSVGATLFPVLELGNKKIQGEGVVQRNDQNQPVCTMTFHYNGLDYKADLDCLHSRATALTKFRTGPDAQ